MKKTTSKKIAAVILSAATALSMLAGCGSSASTSVSESTPVSTETSVSEEVVEEAKGYSEAPMLAEQVSAGTLPAVEERIPDEDNIFVETTDVAGDTLAIGTYGGDLDLAYGGGSWDISRPILETIVHYNNDGSYYPNVIKSYEVSEDYKTWTFHLREGMKWSDGVDFTADDITFWYYQCHLTNFDGKLSWTALIDGSYEAEEVNAETGVTETVTKNTYAKLTKVDDYTVTWTFENPKYPADFIENGDFKFCWAPSHYLSDLIPDSIYVENEYWPATGLSDEDVLANAQAKTPAIDQASIKDLGKAVVYNFWNTSGIPTLNSFVLTTKEGNNTRNSELCILERNAYYWKVDAEGNQLPYVDQINLHMYSEEGQDQLAFRSGELDVLGVAMADISSLLADLGDTATLTEASSSNWGSYQVTFNYSSSDENYATLFNNIAFREAMSICVDRDQVSLLLSDSFLEPGQAAPSEGNFGYDAEWETKWTEYDVEKAKTLLESCGLVMGDDGYYNFADGSDLLITFYTYTDSGAEAAFPVLEQYYKAVGIDCAQKDMEVGTFDTTIDNNDWIAVLGPHTAIGGISMRSRVAPFIPIAQAAEWYGDFGTYYQTNGEQGVEPTGDMAKLVELYEEYISTPITSERDAINEEVLEIHKANLWTLAYLKAESNYTLISNKVKNYPVLYVYDDLYQYANMVHYWTVYVEE